MDHQVHARDRPDRMNQYELRGLTHQQTPVDVASRGQYAKVEEALDREAEADSDDDFDSSAVTVDEPTEFELRTLRRVPDDLPWSAFLIAIVEFCERFAFYGLSGPFQNYIANKWKDQNGLPGAIGLNQGGATALTNFFIFWCYTTPVFAAVIADQYLGRYRTILYAALIYIVGVFVLFVTSLPQSIESGLALPGLIVAMIIIGAGTGGIKSNVSAMIADQYTNTRRFIKTTRSGERVIVDPAVTMSRIYMIFYLCINVGSLSSAITTTLEAKVGFWSAYLLCLCMFVVGFITLVQGRNRYVLQRPSGSPVFDAFKVIAIGLRSGSLDAAKPERISSSKPELAITWDSTFVDELRRALGACTVFLFFPVYWLTQNQMGNNFVSQAGQMQRHNIPNDLMINLDPICIIIMIPICDRYIFPLLNRVGFAGPIIKIFLGFLLGAAAMAWAALTQSFIYASSPCFTAPAACEAGLRSDGTYAPNNVSILMQIPAYLLVAMSEIFASVPGLEYAYTKAPAKMKSFIMGLFLLTSAGGAAFGMLVSPFAVDPNLTALYFWLGLISAISALIFWVLFRKRDVEDAKAGSTAI